MLCNSFALQIGRTALHHAVLDGKTDMVSFLMANFNTSLEAKDAVSVHSTTDYPNMCSSAGYRVHVHGCESFDE